MGDLLDKASAFLSTMRDRHMAKQVVYRRGTSTVDLPAMIGKTTFEIANQFGVELIESRDFLIAAFALVIDNNATLPADGDRIEEIIGGVVYIYEVSAPAGLAMWAWSDPYRQTVRIHTKKIEETATPAGSQ